MIDGIAQTRQGRSTARLRNREQEPAESYAVAKHVERFLGAGRAVVHDELRRQLFELNETADLIWQGLTSAEGDAEAVAGLEALGFTTSAARSHVREAAAAWTSAGYMAPQSAARKLGSPPDELRQVVLDDASLEIAFHGTPAWACDEVAGSLLGVGETSGRLAVVAHGGQFLFFMNGEIRSACPPERLAPHLKSTLADFCMAVLDRGFLVHGAMLSGKRGAVILSGAPGAGKSTLALAMCAAGWGFGCDDMVRVRPDGGLAPLPFAACLKSGAWPLLAPMWPSIGTLASWTRTDGQRVRYLTPPSMAGISASGVHAVVVLARAPGAAATLSPIAPLEALQALVGSAYSPDRAATNEALRMLAAHLETARCRRLTYSDLDEAVQLLEDLQS